MERNPYIYPKDALAAAYETLYAAASSAKQTGDTIFYDEVVALLKPVKSAIQSADALKQEWDAANGESEVK